MKSKPNKEILDAMHRNPDYWKGPFYCNRKDYRIIVPKYNPMMGWTLNFASPYSLMGIVAIVLIIAATQIFM
jgi:uncharacterized membrane protein